jgi:hypothetical protein
MDGNRKALKERWQQRTDTAFERMFAGKSDEELRTLTQRESMAMAIARELAAFVLEEHVALDRAVQPAEESTTCCPKCGQPGQRAVKKNGKLAERPIVTQVGEISLRRERWRCPKCRVIFFPLDVRLELGTEGFSPAVLQKAVRQGSKASSFEEASDDLRELAQIEISPTHIQRVSERIGGEWREHRDADVAKFRELKLERDYPEASSGAAAVMLDGGRAQTRADDSGRGVTAPGWRETKVGCCLTLQTKAAEKDPHPEPPAKFLEPITAGRLAAEIKRRRAVSSEKAAVESERLPGKKGIKKKKKAWKRSRSGKKAKRIRVRTVVATMEDSDAFGWQVAAEVHRRGLDRVKRKACVCDGQAYNWSVYEMHLRPLDFVPILDFVHLLAYLYDAAHAACRGDAVRGWKQYEQWLRLAWSGKATELLTQLQAALRELQRGRTATSELQTLSETVTYVTNNRERMAYPEYRRLGLPTSSAPVESTIKQINRRIKGSEKFWLVEGAEAMLQLRAAQISDDGRWLRNWHRPRKHRRSVGTGRLNQAI